MSVARGRRQYRGRKNSRRSLTELGTAPPGDNATPALENWAAGADRYDVVFHRRGDAGHDGIELAQEIRRYHATAGRADQPLQPVRRKRQRTVLRCCRAYSMEQLSRVLHRVARWRRMKRASDAARPETHIAGERHANSDFFLTRFWISARGYWGRGATGWHGCFRSDVDPDHRQCRLPVRHQCWNRAIFDAIENANPRPVSLTAVFFPACGRSVLLGVAQVVARWHRAAGGPG